VAQAEPPVAMVEPSATLPETEERSSQSEPRRLAELAPAATIWRAPSGVREQRWEPPTGR
jgi:hypothetical protein